MLQLAGVQIGGPDKGPLPAAAVHRLPALCQNADGAQAECRQLGLSVSSSLVDAAGVKEIEEILQKIALLAIPASPLLSRASLPARPFIPLSRASSLAVPCTCNPLQQG